MTSTTRCNFIKNINFHQIKTTETHKNNETELEESDMNKKISNFEKRVQCIHKIWPQRLFFLLICVIHTVHILGRKFW